ncbi:FadR/GntR family transcriptional regulator [Kocuria marina]|uniref:FadR/GntR family transcriptional regulator n=1 Tax=Kocuria marina TaxID=223184 RepID=UPI0022E57698|nr:FCD domain-containing protein [Kocuria marina]
MSDMAAPRGKYTMEQLQQGITDLILDRGLRIGDPVPPESELREVFGVSRNSLREALKMLQAVGIVEIRHGYGTFVAGHPLTALRRTLQFRARLSLQSSGVAAQELVDVREALECGLVGRAIAAMDPHRLDRLTEIVADMEAAAERGESLRTTDRDFHHVLFEPIDNAFLSELLTVFWDVYSGIHQSVETLASENTDHVTDTAAAHRDILAAVVAGDEMTAARLLGAHFVGIRRLIDRATADAHPVTASLQEARI